uniref:Dna-directed rna polymerase alpha chain n=1 Tax=Prototheca stagnorum TaxID=215448 RepID=A0A2Z6BEL9_9CHLO|nr:dna-directed rna polymerase alpha chain [Prototheca stagnorum]BBD20172.1 dna-directed rna polymerase alpha chain [Prototheca stagnorum]
MKYFFTFKYSQIQGHLTYNQYILGFFKRGEGTAFANILRQHMLSLEFTKQLFSFSRLDIFDIQLTSISRNIDHDKELLSRLKNSIFFSFGIIEKPIRLYLKVKGPIIVTLEMLDLPQNIICLDPKMIIDTLFQDEEIELNFTVISKNLYNLKNTDSVNLTNKELPIEQISFFIEEVVNPKGITLEYITLNIWTRGDTLLQNMQKSIIKLALYQIAKKFLFFAAILYNSELNCFYKY